MMTVKTWVNDFVERHPHLSKDIDLVVCPPEYAEVVQAYPDAACEPELAAGEVRFAKGCHDDRGHGLTVLALYLMARRNQTPHNMAVMLAVQRAPTCETTDTFWSGRKRFDQVHGELYANTIRHKLAAQGVRLGHNEEYMPELARYVGDPQAVIPFDGARSRIRKLCEQRGWGCNGAVTVKESEPLADPRDKKVPLAKNLVEKERRLLAAKDEKFRNKSVAEQREIVLQKHGPSR